MRLAFLGYGCNVYQMNFVYFAMEIPLGYLTLFISLAAIGIIRAVERKPRRMRCLNCGSSRTENLSDGKIVCHKCQNIYVP